MGTTDGLGFEEVNQAVTSTEIISGANVYGSTSVQSALITGTAINGTTVSGTTVKGTTISGTNIVNSQGLLTSNATGSPFAYGKRIVAGTGTLGAGSDAWIVFPTVLAGSPSVVLATNTKTVNGVIATGSYSVGSFVAFGENAADTFCWLAI